VKARIIDEEAKALFQEMLMDMDSKTRTMERRKYWTI